MTHHKLDVHPIPEEGGVLFINETQFAGSYDEIDSLKEEDNIRVYVPMDMSKEAILNRLSNIKAEYGSSSEENEFSYSREVNKLVEQIEIYDQIWFVREGNFKTDNMGRIHGHSTRATELVKEFVAELEGITDECAEMFPFDLIEELNKEYLSEE